MEERLGDSFDDVRVHADADAARSADAAGAVAYTVGTHVAFARGAHAPRAPHGERLLAHELTHVVQQRARRPSPLSELTIGPERDAHEREAARVSAGVSRPRPTGAAGGIQRQAAIGRPGLYCFAKAGWLSGWFADRYNDWRMQQYVRHSSEAWSDPALADVAERMYDAWGHCFIACCMQSPARARWIGWALEAGHEALRSILGHDSLRQDLYNQGYGRYLASHRPDVDCAEGCLWAMFDNALDLTLAGYPRGASLEGFLHPRPRSEEGGILFGRLPPEVMALPIPCSPGLPSGL